MVVPETKQIKELLLAVQKAEIDTIQSILQSNPSLINQRGTDLFPNCTALDVAVMFGHLKVVRLLIQEGAFISEIRTEKINNHFYNVQSPLHLALSHKHTKVAKFLIEKGALLDVCCGENQATPIHFAAVGGTVDLLKLLLEKDPKLINQRTVNGETPLIIAILSGNEQTAKYLISEDDITAKTKAGGVTALHQAIYAKQFTIAHELIKRGAPLKDTVESGLLPIHLAATAGDLKSIQLMLDRNPELVNAKDDYQQTPLLWAASRGHSAIVEFLLKKGADIDTVTVVNPKDFASYAEHNGKSALHWALTFDRKVLNEFSDERAIKQKHFATARLLIRSEAKLDLPAGLDDSLPIHRAAMEGDVDSIQLMLKTKPDLIDAIDCCGRTPLFRATIAGRKDVVASLLQANANPNIESTEGETSLDVAIKYQDEDIIKLLLTKTDLTVGKSQTTAISKIFQIGNDTLNKATAGLWKIENPENENLPAGEDKASLNPQGMKEDKAISNPSTKAHIEDHVEQVETHLNSQVTGDETVSDTIPKKQITEDKTAQAETLDTSSSQKERYKALYQQQAKKAPWKLAAYIALSVITVGAFALFVSYEDFWPNKIEKIKIPVDLDESIKVIRKKLNETEEGKQRDPQKPRKVLVSNDSKMRIYYMDRAQADRYQFFMKAAETHRQEPLTTKEKENLTKLRKTSKGC